MSPATTRWPSAASARTIARPMPPAPPVTRATRGACAELAIAAKYCVGAGYDAARGEIRASRVAERGRPDDRQSRRGSRAGARRAPPDAPLGNDPSVTEALPWLLDTLDGHGLTRHVLRRGDQHASCTRTRCARSPRAATGSGSMAGATRSGRSLSAADERDILTRARRGVLGAGARGAGVQAAGRRAELADAGAAARGGSAVVLAGRGRRRRSPWVWPTSRSPGTWSTPIT